MCKNRVETAPLELQCPALRCTVSFCSSNCGFLMQDCSHYLKKALCIVRCKYKVLPGFFSWVTVSWSSCLGGAVKQPPTLDLGITEVLLNSMMEVGASKPFSWEMPAGKPQPCSQFLTWEPAGVTLALISPTHP